MRYDEEEQVKRQIAFWIRTAVIVALAMIVLFGAFYIVGAGERAVLLTFGAPSMEAKAPGLHMKIPLVQQVVIMNVQTQKYEVAKTSAASKDLQTVTTDITINYIINPDSVPMIYQNLGAAYRDTIINPAVLETMKQVTALFTAEELITRRPEVKDAIDTALTARLKAFNINVQAVSITNFEFSEVFTVSIENKVTAQQNALAAENKLAQVKFEAQQAIAQANGQSTAMALIGNDRYVQLQAIAKWDGHMPLATGNAMPFINLNTATVSSTA